MSSYNPSILSVVAHTPSLTHTHVQLPYTHWCAPQLPFPLRHAALFLVCALTLLLLSLVLMLLLFGWLFVAAATCAVNINLMRPAHEAFCGSHCVTIKRIIIITGTHKPIKINGRVGLARRAKRLSEQKPTRSASLLRYIVEA